MIILKLFVYLVIIPLYVIFGWLYLILIAIFYIFSPYDYDQDGRAYKLDEKGFRVYKDG